MKKISKENLKVLLNWISGLTKEVKYKMSGIWGAFESMRGKHKELFKSLQDYIEEAERTLLGGISELSVRFHELTEEKKECDVCGTPKEDLKGWVYIEKDYEFYTDGGHIEVKENTQELLCPKCYKKSFAVKAPKKKKGT